jgi:hypothetical protein
VRLNYKNIFFLLIIFVFNSFCNILKADEVLYNGTCINGGTLKLNSTTIDKLSKNGFDLAKIYNFNLTFNQKDLKYCNLVEKYLTINPFTGEKFKNKIATITLTFTPEPYNPKYIPQYVSLTTGGYVPASCGIYQIADIKKNNINDRFIQIIINNNNFKHSRDDAGARERICK